MGRVAVGVALGLLAMAVSARGGEDNKPDAPPAEIRPTFADPALDRLTSTQLETFPSQQAFDAYWRDVNVYANGRRQQINLWYKWYQSQRQKKGAARIGSAQLVSNRDRLRRSERAGARLQDGSEQMCTDPECFGEGDSSDADSVIVTGSRIGGSSRSSAPSRASRPARSGGAPNITNVQTAGVDEGDIVKQIGDYLAVLQDGRIFVVNTANKALTLTDRANIYVHRNDGAWYDEMLVEGDRIIVTAYSYGNQATEITIFHLNQANGKLAREGRFFLNSYDYYSGKNYASRIIGDNLVLYTLYSVYQLTNRGGTPRLWRWTEDGEKLRGDGKPAPEISREGRALVDPQTLHRPLLRTASPFVHVVTICPLASYKPGGVPACRVSSFVGPAAREFFVSTEAIYLWVGENGWSWDVPRVNDDKRCAASPRADAMSPSVVYRVPVDGGAPGVVGLRGQPVDQFSMDMTRDTFRIFTRWSLPGCYAAGSMVGYRFTNVPLRDFRKSLSDVPEERQIPAPAPGPGSLENRFADDWFVYGGRTDHYQVSTERGNEGRPLHILPVEQPDKAMKVDLPHNIIRLERVGEDRIAASGYRLRTGLDLSLIQLGRHSYRTDTAYLHNRFESEGRSHAFNSQIEENRSGLMGIPTIEKRKRASRFVWNSAGSDVSFLTVSRNGAITSAGPLVQSKATPEPGYRCEVSCIDWYGNSRPIFTDGRIFALMATEIAEGRLAKGRIREVQRLNLTGPVDGAGLR